MNLKAIPKKEVLIFSLFILLALLITYPLIFNFKSSIFGFKDSPADTEGVIHGFWWIKYSSQNNLPLLFNSLVAAPFGADHSYSPVQPLFLWFIKLLNLLGDEFFSYNFLVLSGFILSAIGMYCLTYHFTGDRISSMVSGIIYGFFPNILLRGAAGHLTFVHAEFMPLYALFLFKVFEKADFKNAFLSAFFLFCTVLFNFYFGFFMAIFTLLFFLWRGIYFFLREGRIGIDSLRLKIIFLTLALSLLMVLPLTYKIFFTFLSPPEDVPLESYAYVRDYRERWGLSVRIWDYLLPSEYNPVFGECVEKTIRQISRGRQFWDRTVYMGIIPLFLSVMGYWEWKRRLERYNKEREFGITFLVLTGITSVYFSFPPLISLYLFDLPAPSFFLYKIAPMFRAYARFSYILMLCIGVLAGMGLSYVLKRQKSNAMKFITVSLITFGILMEFSIVPPWRNVDYSNTPEVYQWLARQKGDFIIAEYPLEIHYHYFFHQRIHKKRLVNGAVINTPPDWIRRSLFEITEKVPSALSALGVKYILLNKGYYERYNPEVLYNISLIPGFKLIQDFGDVTVYEVVDKPAPLIFAQDGFYSEEKWSDGRLWRWMAKEGKFVFYVKDERRDISLYFKATSFNRKRNLRLFLSGSLIKEIAVPHQGEEVAVRIKNLNLKKGINLITLRTDPSAENIDTIIHSGDKREVSIAISNLRWETRGGYQKQVVNREIRFP